MTEASILYEQIIKNDYCIGCGACASVDNSPFKMVMNEFGNIVAYADRNLNHESAQVLKICPFSDDAKNEEEISNIYFSKVENKDYFIGRYLLCFAGYVNEGTFRINGSSGGLAKWLGYILLDENKIDFFIQVVSNKSGNPLLPLFNYAVFSNKEDVIKGSRSSYYPVSLDNILKLIKEKEGRYAITGVPCFIKALRLLSLENDIIRSRIRFTLGIVCGGMKSANHAKFIGWQLGVKPDNLIGIEFRKKHPDKPAGNKIYQVWSNLDEIERYKEASLIFGTDWGPGYFKPNACDYCDDVIAETADISFGDAWLPQFESDPGGTSVVVVRNEEIAEILHRYRKGRNITLFDLSCEDVIKSQEAGFRHRREALSFRLAKKEKANIWHPQKRVSSNEFKINMKRKLIYSLREKIAKQSHLSAYRALNKNDLSLFLNEMYPLARKYYMYYDSNLFVRAVRKLIKCFSKIKPKQVLNN
jgi:coenzyme F420 hydrogenase subunit beta